LPNNKAPYFYSENGTPLVIAHRGAMGVFPEHTNGSYSSAYMEGVDFVELDLQITKDGQLITSHDPTLKDVSDIEEKT
jgi:glycerophosphoryl diester phosphodiesterase